MQRLAQQLQALVDFVLADRQQWRGGGPRWQTHPRGESRRQALGVELLAAVPQWPHLGQAKAALGRQLDELGDKRPALVRGDSGHADEGILAELESRGMETITSRPLLLAAVGKAVSHANQTTLYLTPLHGQADILKRLIAKIGAALRHVKAAAEQFKDHDRWGCLMRDISERISPFNGPPQPPPGLPASGQLPDPG